MCYFAVLFIALTTRDTIRFISKLSLRKIANALRVVSSYYVSQWTGRPIQWGMPFNISVEPTTQCNLSCPECPSGLKSFTRPTGQLEEAFYYDLIEQLDKTLIYLYFYFQGEPYLHPRFTDLVRYASQRGIYTVTSTNAHYLTERRARETIEAGLDRILISIDGTTQEVYEQYRIGGSLHKVLAGTRALVNMRRQMGVSHPHIIFQYLVVRPNEHQIAEVYALAKDIGVDEVHLKTAQLYDYQQGNPLMPTIDQYSRYSSKPDGSYQLKNPLANHCWKLWHSCVVTWDGKVVPCCFDKDASHATGDLHNQSFDKLWFGAAYQSFRSKVLRSRSEIDICTNCSEGTKVWA
jgi:radical SAM protein with 4Fe4S-binding SPASM domain